jgi:hypothetical protein
MSPSSIAQVIVGSLNDWQKERQFKALNERKEERGVKVIRDGVEKVIDIKVRLLLFCFLQFLTQPVGGSCWRHRID